MNKLSWISRLRIGPERLALIFLLAFNMVGVSYRWAWAVAQPWQGIFWAAPTLTLLVCAVVMLTAAPASEMGNDRRTAPLILGGIAFSFVLTLYQTTATSGVLLAVPALGVGAVLLLRFGTVWRITDFLVATAVAWTAYYTLQGDYQQIGGDLLPIIMAACQNLLHGLDPYTANYSHVTSNPFFYLPLQWLPYFPAAALGCDPRVVTVVIFLIFVGVVRLNAGAEMQSLPAMLLLSLLVTAISARAMARTYMLPSWILLACFTFAFSKGRNVVAALLLGCLLATRQTFVPDAVAVLVGVVFQMQIWRVLALAAISAVTAGAIFLPFMIYDTKFLWRTFVHGPALALAGNSGNLIASGQVGIVPLFGRLGLEAPSAAVQGTMVLLALAAIGLRRPKERLSLSLCVAGVDLLTALSGGQTFEYYWGSSFVIAGTALCCFPVAEPELDKAQKGWADDYNS